MESGAIPRHAGEQVRQGSYRSLDGVFVPGLVHERCFAARLVAEVPGEAIHRVVVIANLYSHPL